MTDLEALKARLRDDDPWFDSRDRRDAAEAIERLEAAIDRQASAVRALHRNEEFENNLRRYKIITECRSGNEWMQEEYTVLDLNLDSVKWYDEFSYIQAWDVLMESASDSFELDYEFIRCGEDATDIDRQYTPTSLSLLGLGRPEIFSTAEDMEIIDSEMPVLAL